MRNSVWICVLLSHTMLLCVFFWLIKKNIEKNAYTHAYTDLIEDKWRPHLLIWRNLIVHYVNYVML